MGSLNINLGLDIGVLGLMLSTLVELQTIVLALECVLLLSSVKLFSDSQSALDACKSELGLACPDFHNQCWIERCHIVNVIYNKNLKVSWHKIKDHSGISENEHTDAIAGDASLSDWYLPYYLGECFIVANGSVVSDNSRYFVGSGFKFLAGGLFSEINWLCLSLVWHSNLYMATGFTSEFSANACSYFIKALHHQLPVAVQKCFYNRLYLSVLCLYYGNMEALNHVFSYKIDDSVQCQLLKSYVDSWKAISGFFYSSSDILQMLFSCVFNSSLVMAFYKDFVFNDWFHKAVTIFHNLKVAGLEIIKFVYSLSLDFRSNVWSVRAKYHAYMEKNELISLDSLVLISVSGLASELSVGVIKLLGTANAFNVHFGFCKSCLFFSDISNSVSVHIVV
ncbi:hypothetical protein G9A89_010576 [Geosiphon pyriformis]|nr:hypothetical protein G9A89_010576 [Geosiphon pyriformis]